MTGILLDTNALIWMAQDSPRLGPAARARLAGGEKVWFSAVSVLEVNIKLLLGKLKLPGDLAEAARSMGLAELAFTSDDAQELLGLPGLDRHDPFDRMLLAQAARIRCDLMTADKTLLGLGLAGVFDARL